MAEDTTSWQEVAEQISAQPPLPDMKKSLRQLRRGDDRPIPPRQDWSLPRSSGRLQKSLEWRVSRAAAVLSVLNLVGGAAALSGLCFLCGWISGASYRVPWTWCPTLLARARRYASSVYAIAVEEQAVSRWVEVATGIPILSAASSLPSWSVFGRFWIFPKMAAAHAPCGAWICVFPCKI